MREERGVALLVALIVAILLSLLGLSLTYSSLKEASVSTEYENHERALTVADAGFSAAKQLLRGMSIDEALHAESMAPSYLTGTGGVDANWAARNPISPLDARNIDFDNPLGGGSHLVNGLLTPPTGVEFADGRYFAKLTDNDDEPTGVTNDPKTDTDGIVVLRVVGITRGAPGEMLSYGSTRKNSVAIIEAHLKRDLSFDMDSPLSLVADEVDARFNGTSFLADGFDHSGMTLDDLTKSHKKSDDALDDDQAAGLEAFPGISCLYDNPPTDAENAVEDVADALGKNKDNVIGEDGANSLFDYTEEVRNSDNPDAKNVLNPAFLETVAKRLGAWADTRYKTNASIKGNATFGTHDDPKVTYADEDLAILGNTSGAGLLVVRGKLECGGSFEFEGLVLVLGKGSVLMHGANQGILGGMLVANLPGDGSLGTAELSFKGNSNFYFAGDAISLALDLIGMRTLSWREITPEIEPGS